MTKKPKRWPVKSSFFQVPYPSCPASYYDQYGRLVIYDAWNGKPEYVEKDEKIQERMHIISAVLIVASVLLICLLIGLR